MQNGHVNSRDQPKEDETQVPPEDVKITPDRFAKILSSISIPETPSALQTRLDQELQRAMREIIRHKKAGKSFLSFTIHGWLPLHHMMQLCGLIRGVGVQAVLYQDRKGSDGNYDTIHIEMYSPPPPPPSSTSSSAAAQPPHVCSNLCVGCGMKQLVV